jgi:hypothetical protein
MSLARFLASPRLEELVHGLEGAGRDGRWSEAEQALGTLRAELDQCRRSLAAL